jgi:hypothetical protein
LFFNSLYSMHESKKLQNVQKISSKSWTLCKTF